MFEKRPVIALDFHCKEEVEKFLAQFDSNEQLYIKIGMELFYQEGPSIVTYLKELGHSVFLDLKLHDIPNTVKSAMIGLAKMGVDMVNVHAAGGFEMMKQAIEGLEEGTPEGAKRPILIAVTQLTSTSEEDMHRDQLIQVPIENSVVHYARRAREAGLDGVVCSALEVAMIKRATDKNFICLTPGIRPKGAEVGDQKRVKTPSEARRIGSDYIVVGRPITLAEKPVDAYHEILKDWNYGN
ncbi:orotidine-5'-phosphate decarboxylase [Pilibacter termitis]|uniref:Orotidine 5'-phosphate decarboxylase n=1 Tax=Pilibacter termitis TaxID=263852 RepID=A0A1T4RIS8_9ENTE|nr:orotidine-5'-phosphate decarboxylase [Pilibacter termitis]SKA15892.1 orotidine-5'-phosphate decarboxylase [Pilibacter termitis]